MRKKLTLSIIEYPVRLVVIFLSFIYLVFTWNQYQIMLENETLQVAESISSLLHTNHIEILVSEEENENIYDLATTHAEKLLANLVETTDSIYYSYILDNVDGETILKAKSGIVDNDTSQSIQGNRKEIKESNLYPFKNNKSVITKPITTKYGEEIRVLVPISNQDDNVLAVLGLIYSAKEWKTSLYKRMIPDLIIILIVNLLIYTIFKICDKNKRLAESERSKSVILSQLPGMAFRSKNDSNWTMEWVSEGCYNLTGYHPNDLINNQKVSYADLINFNYSENFLMEWEGMLRQRKRYTYEYELVTQDKKRKWVLEIGEGLYDKVGNIQALEGVIFDITDRKLKDHQIENFQDYDLLTGLFNRNFMDEELKKLNKEKFLPLSIILCDIDGLAMINDAYGYEEGDNLIRWTANIIEDCLEGAYTLGHLGGGEFLVLLPFTNKSTVKQLEEKIKVEMEKRIKYNTKKLYTTNLSICYNTMESLNQDLEELLKQTETYLKRRKLLQQNSSHSAIVSSIMASLYAKSEETKEHGQRLGEYCLMIGNEMELPQATLDDLLLLSKLHDIGKIGVDDQILNKPGRLTNEEWIIMKQHPEIGYQIAMTTPQLEHIAEPILYHHEHWDGKGYPKGLAGEDIPLTARILSLVDAYDAMTEDRVYRKAMSKKEAIDEIRKNAGTQFDPNLAKIFIEILER